MKKGNTQRVSKPQRIAILDAGSQFGGLIDRNVRELGFRTTMLPLDTPVARLKEYAAVIISGGPKSVEEAGAYLCDPDIIHLDKPLLGICYGMQLLAKLYGGNVGPGSIREDGPQTATFEPNSLLFKGIPRQQTVLMTHGDSVLTAPAEFTVSGQSGPLIAAMENEQRQQYGVQFHPEVYQTECGPAIFRNFLFSIAGLEADYTIADQEQEAIRHIKSIVQDKDVLVFVSGGVDSAVMAALVAKAVSPDRIHAFHIDTGFMRENESRTVIAALEAAGLHVTLLDTAETFYHATTIIDGQKTPPLNQVVEPQMKRKIMGDAFIHIRSQILKDYQIDDDSVLAQGSLRPDLIESGSLLASSKADTIKTHHNDSEQVRELRRQNRVVEPLQELYKDQVRALGRRLGLPPTLVERQPFPGPGLAIRIICAEKPYQQADHEQVQSELDSLVLKRGYEAYQAHVLPIRTVGVQGDGRSYKYLVGLTGPADWQQLSKLAAIIPNNIHSVNRVVYIFGSEIDRQPLGITPTHLTPDALAQLRQADHIVNDALSKHKLMTHISQMPVILFPVNFGLHHARSIGLRPFLTPDFMTGVAAKPATDIPVAVVDEMVSKILTEVPGIARVVFDLTSKPPGTTEWE